MGYNSYWYKEEDLISFGKFLLSDDRMKSRIESALDKGMNIFDALNYAKEVFDADIANWKDAVGIKVKDDSELFNGKEADTQEDIDDRFYNIAAKKIFAHRWQRAREAANLAHYIPEEKQEVNSDCSYPDCDCDEEVQVIVVRLM